MYFIDHTGHIFSNKSYDEFPYGYEYNNNDYVFWLDEEYTHQLSVSNYYIIPIRLLVNKEISSFNVHVESDVFSLIPSTLCDEYTIEDNKYIEFEEKNFKKDLTIDDIKIIDDLDADGTTFSMIPFYIVGNAKEEGTWMTNVLITIDNSEWSYITVAGTFIDNYEELVINGHNMGVQLPKDILKAIYQSSYYNDEAFETLYNSKLKEYLINYMNIRGECGNYQSAIDSLKWFGYGNKITITRLLQTDNQFLNQYIHDVFTVDNDILESYSNFRNSTFIALTIPENAETEKYNDIIFDNDFTGEGKPIYENLFKKMEVHRYDEQDIDFIRPYYDYVFDEMGLKLACLAYMYKKYFLPIHLSVHSASLAHKVFANDIKLVNGASVKIAENPIMCGYDKYEVVFPEIGIYYIYNQRHIVDTNMNLFNYYDDEYALSSSDKYVLIDDPCIRIPIRFMHSDSDIEQGKIDYYNCVLIIKKNDDCIFESHFAFSQDEEHKYDSLIIQPKYINEDFDINWWLNSDFTIYLLCNDIWYEHDFIVRVPEFQLNFGKLVYNYYDKLNNGDIYTYHRQIKSIDDDKVDFNAFMYLPQLADINDINFFDTLKSAVENVSFKTEQEYEHELHDYLLVNYGIYTITASQSNDTITMHINLNDDNGEWFDNNTIVIVNGHEAIFDQDTNSYISNYKMTTKESTLENITLSVIVKRNLLEPILNSDKLDYLYTVLINPHEITDNLCYCQCELINLYEQASEEDKPKYKCQYKFNEESNVTVIDENRITSESTEELPDKDKIISDIVDQQMQSLIDRYVSEISLSNNKKYFNHMHIYYIYDENDNMLVYDEAEDIVPLYRKFFYDNGDTKMLPISDFPYDFYLMHDKDYWYAVFISKNTIDKDNTDGTVLKEFTFESLDDITDSVGHIITIQDNGLLFDNTIGSLYKVNDKCVKKINDKFWYAYENGLLDYCTTLNPVKVDIALTYEYTGYKFRLDRSDDRILINRLKFINTQGVNHFAVDDIIAAYIDNVDFPYMLSFDAQWKFSKYSITPYASTPVYYKGSAAIISIEPENTKYKPGYYDIDVRYSIDGYIQHQQKLKGRIKIN